MVCCAVSAITQTALAGVLYHGENYINCNMENGLLDISVHDSHDRELTYAFKTILRTMLLGLREVLKEYPEKIKLKVSRDFDI